MNGVEQLVRRGVAKFAIVLENDQLPHCHLAAGRTVIVFEHVEDGLPQQLQILLREAGDPAGKVGGDKAFRAVEGIGDDVLVAHLGAFFLRVGFGGDGHAGDGDFLRQDGVDAAGKAQLYRPAHLSAVERALDKGGHHRAEGADVKKVLAHKVPNFPIKLGVVFFGGLQVLAHPQILQRLRVAALQGNLILDVDAVAGIVLLDRLHIVADLALEADIGHQPVAGFWVDAGHVAGVRVAVGVAVLHIEQDNKIVAVFDGFRHGYCSSLLVLAV